MAPASVLSWSNHHAVALAATALVLALLAWKLFWTCALGLASASVGFVDWRLLTHMAVVTQHLPIFLIIACGVVLDAAFTLLAVAKTAAALHRWRSRVALRRPEPVPVRLWRPAPAIRRGYPY